MAKNQAGIPIRVRIDKILSGNGPTKAFVSVTTADAFAAHDLRISEKHNLRECKEEEQYD